MNGRKFNLDKLGRIQSHRYYEEEEGQFEEEYGNEGGTDEQPPVLQPEGGFVADELEGGGDCGPSTSSTLVGEESAEYVVVKTEVAVDGGGKQNLHQFNQQKRYFQGQQQQRGYKLVDVHEHGHRIDDNSSYVLEDGGFYLNDTAMSRLKPSGSSAAGILPQSPSRNIRHYEKSAVDIPRPISVAGVPPPAQSPLPDSNICCGLCGEIVAYERLVTDHLPAFHPEILKDGIVDLEEIPYEVWVNDKMQQNAQSSRQHGSEMPMSKPAGAFLQHRLQLEKAAATAAMRSTRQLRRISQYRVNTAEMDIPQLEKALKIKMVEKLGRQVPVTLVDKLHAKCGICNTHISLNKKFEIVHLVRHFNAWHPASHNCAGTWPNSELPSPMGGKPLSAKDFAVINPETEADDNLQCIWCGMFLSNKTLGIHFHEIHPEEVEVPRCNLCMQELLINARLSEKYGDDFAVTMPNEHTYRCNRFNRDYKTVLALERAISKFLHRVNEKGDELNGDDDPIQMDGEENEMYMDLVDYDEDEEGTKVGSCKEFANSRMKCGRRAKPKRQFIAPICRQACPKDSQFVTALTHSHWKCRLCAADIYAAVISSGVIKHFKKCHPFFLPNVQLELCKARLDKISDGKMDFVGDELIECSLCSQSIPVTPAFNICRAISHLKKKHPEVMPEHRGGESSRDGFLKSEPGQNSAEGDIPLAHQEMEEGVIYATEVSDQPTMEMLRQNYGVTFDKVFSVYGREIQQQIYILCGEGDELDAETVEQIAKVRDPTQNPMVVQINKASNSTTDTNEGTDGALY